MTLSPGARLGPYEVVEPLGAGGMGEVYRARDPRLGRDVAVKVLPEEVADDAQRLGFFEREARAVAALNHPNILTVHDVGRHEGIPYVVTELLEGENLRELASRRTPTVRQILAYALQAARGLEAAHAKDIVHRDLKPENLFLTTDGRVKVLDFGLAKLVRREEVHTDAPTPSRSTAAGQVVGTVAYMSPEQARGHPVGPRSDVFSFGVVLYELLAGKHPFKKDTAAATLTAIVEETPAALEGLGRGIPPAVGGIVRRCLEKATDGRYGSGHDVAMVLDAVLAAPSEAVSLLEVEERSPYPGLSSFTEKDAEVFFGREREIDELWGRIQSRKLLAVIGPSGAGKTSFVRAGVIASRPEGWVAVHVTPGSNPGLGLARALTPQLAGEAEAIGELLTGLEELRQAGETERVVSAVKRWRSRHAEALLVMDQFEELFTLNLPETQARIAALLERLASEADVHVVLSMRDDFLIRCSDHAPLAPVFSEITPLTALSKAGLRRAVVEPAKKAGYRFEDDALVEEMVSLVEGNRGALPLLAFAVARLWEKRDREERLLTREAYQEIGGVEGALAQHAEATMDRIGSERQGLVREIFRNLVTAQGTRAVIDQGELLSAFSDKEAATGVLGRLIDARLLTSYEVEGKEDEPAHHRVEIVHESLLNAWPRLVRWQAQDEEGALLRDQLKQAAHLWDEKGRTPDLLWSGTAFREYELWRERYPGKLTALEEDFSDSMVERAQRRRRLRRLMATSVVAVAVVVASVTALLWLRSEAARERAAAAALRAEASKLMALGQARFDKDPTEALAFATASLELADTREARVFTMRTLWKAPPAFEVIGGASVTQPVFSPDGRWLAVSGFGEEVGVWAETGEKVAVLSGHQLSNPVPPRWSQTGLLVTNDRGVGAHLWSFPGGQRVGTIEFGAQSWWQVGPEHLLAETFESFTPDGQPETMLLRSWRLPDGEPEVLGQVNRAALGTSSSCFAPDGAGWLYTKGRTVYFRPLPVDGRSDRILSQHDSDVRAARFLGNNRIAYGEESGRFHVYRFSPDGPPRRTRSFLRPETAPENSLPERSGRWLVNHPAEEAVARLWDLGTWPAARPLALRGDITTAASMPAFHPTGDWLVVSTNIRANLSFWPLRRPYPTVVDGYSAIFRPVAFTPDSRSLVTSWSRVGRQLRLWPVGEDTRAGPRPLELPEEDGWVDVSVGPTGDFLFVVGWLGGTFVVPLDGAPARRLEGFADDTSLWTAAVSPSGRQVATALGTGDGEKALRVWDLESGEQKRFDLPEGSRPPAPDGETPPRRSEFEQAIHGLGFVGEATLYSGGDGGIHRWDLESGTHELVFAAQPGHVVTMRLAAQGRIALVRQFPKEDETECLPAEVVDLEEGAARTLPAFGECVALHALALDASGTVAATGDHDGIVRVGRLGRGEPHLLFGHSAAVQNVAISPDLRWVASTADDNTLRLWPMPDLDKPPLHTLPREELLAKLRSLTNLRAVRDPEAPNGWAIELGPFPGWKEVPEW